MTKGKGYLLPSGDATEDELECCLVFYPARDEYRRALMGSLDYLATWIAWERDSGKRGKDAAASWKLANIQTWECCSMGYCDDLMTTLEALLAATTALECCGDQDITDGKQYTDEIVDGEGDVPQNIIDAGYATGVTDWSGFATYKCMISHLAVDHVESFLREIAPHISNTGIVIGGVGVVGALAGAILTLIGLPISAGIIIALGAAAAVWTWITGEGRDAVEDLADEIATNHDALACAIFQGDGVTDSMDSFNDEVDALFTVLDATMIKAINIEPQLRAMYAGRYDQEDIAQKLDDLGYLVSSYSCMDCGLEEPPPGYHLEYPELMTVNGTEGCADNGSTYNPTTGVLVLSWTNVDQGGMQFWAGCNDPNGLADHGYVIQLLAHTIPTDVNTSVPGNLQTDPVGRHVVRWDDSGNWEIGQVMAGYNENAHSGSNWDDWVAQYDFISNRDAGASNRFQFSEYGTPDEDDYSLTFIVRLLVPD